MPLTVLPDVVRLYGALAGAPDVSMPADKYFLKPAIVTAMQKASSFEGHRFAFNFDSATSSATATATRWEPEIIDNAHVTTASDSFLFVRIAP